MKTDLQNRIPKFFSLMWFCIGLIILTSISLVLLFSMPQVHAQELLGFYTNLSGTDEVPPIDTNASGLAVFLYNNDSSELSYLVNVTGLEKINQAVLYNGSRGMNGEVVAPLWEEKSVENKKGSFIMIKDEVKENDLQGPLDDKKIKDLIRVMSNESTYVNVHTDANPNGEIRGQLYMGQIQTNASGDITGLVVPGGVIKLKGWSERDGDISFSFSNSVGPSGNAGGDDCCGGSLVNVEENNIGNNIGNVNTGHILSGNDIKVLNNNEADNTSAEVEYVAGGLVGPVEGTADKPGNTVHKFSDGVQKLLDNDGKDSDDGNSKDDNDGKDSDGDSDGKDTDDGDDKDSDGDSDGDSDKKDSLIHKVKDLLS